MLRDLRYGARILLKSPAFTIVALLMLALGIGANTAIFTVVDQILLRPLPYPHPERLAAVVTIYNSHGKQEADDSADGATFFAIHDRAPAVEAAAYVLTTGVNLVANRQPLYVLQQRVSSGFFHVLGVAPIVGREFNVAEDRAGGPAATVLSYGLWQRAFHGDRSILGRKVILLGEPATIVGIMPRAFRSNEPVDLWTPLRPSTTGEGSGNNYGVIARIRDGHTWSEANSQIELAGRSALPHMPAGVTARMQLTPLQQDNTEAIRLPLLTLWCAVGAVLLIACINIAGLLLARGRTRAREIATRIALGAGHTAVVRQLLAESLLIAVAGGIAGAALGYGGLVALQHLGGETFPALKTATLDARVLAITAALSLATALLFGLAPALRASRTDIRAALAESGRAVAGNHRHWPRRVLVLSEIALSVVLLAGAGLLLRSFAHLMWLQPGVDGTHVITGKISLQDARYATPAAVNRLFDESLRRIRELPGVDSAAVVLMLPYERLLQEGFVFDSGPHAGQRHGTALAYSTPEFFRALRIPILRGRVIADSDTATSEGIAVVNNAFAKAYLRGEDPLGQHIMKREIVGVVGDTLQRPGFGANSPLQNEPIVYIPATQTTADWLKVVHTWFSPDWVVRTSGPVRRIISGMQQAVAAVDPTLPFAGFRTLDDVRAESLSFQRFLSTLLASMAALALVLAVVGLYGLVAQTVAERTHEVGIRMALGATAVQGARAVILPGFILAITGAAAGCILALAATRALHHLLYGVQPTDPATFATAALVVITAAAFASIIAGLRLLHLNPAETLRAE